MEILVNLRFIPDIVYIAYQLVLQLMLLKRKHAPTRFSNRENVYKRTTTNLNHLYIKHQEINISFYYKIKDY